jgi:hypothetical protein
MGVVIVLRFRSSSDISAPLARTSEAKEHDQLTTGRAAFDLKLLGWKSGKRCEELQIGGTAWAGDSIGVALRQPEKPPFEGVFAINSGHCQE